MSDCSPYVKVYGERNSGTKYVEALIRLNLQAPVLPGTEAMWLYIRRRHWAIDMYFRFFQPWRLGWKHAVPPIRHLEKFQSKRPLVLMFIVKNPYAYLLSLFRRPWEVKGTTPETFDLFLSHPWATRRRDGLRRAVLSSPAELWNTKNRAYLEVHRRPDFRSVFIRYEDLLADPEACMEDFCAQTGLRMNSVFTPRLKSANTDTTETYDDYRNFYLNEVWREQYTPERLRKLNPLLDADLMKELGYSLLPVEGGSPEEQSGPSA